MSRKNEYIPSDELLAIQDQYTENRLERVRRTAFNRQRGLMVLMENVYNPHNLGAIARSCDAFGVHHVGYTLDDHEPFDPTIIGKFSSTSASKWLDFRTFETGTTACFNTLKAEGWHILATIVTPGTPSLYDFDFTRHDKLVLLVGNEKNGLSKTAIRLADSAITIPMYGMTRSFNVSVATAITLAEIVRQRRQQPERFLLDDAEADALTIELLQRRNPTESPDDPDVDGN